MADEAEDLDYHITFPSVVPQDYEEDNEEGTPTVRPDTQEPVVLLLGWAGCIDKHLAKYISIYERRCITIRFTAPPRDLFLKPGSQKKAAGKLLELIVELHLTDNPLFFHVFSNGGGMVYSHMSLMVHQERRFSRIKIRGSIFDSAPSRRSMITALKAIVQIVPGYVVFRYLAGLFVVVFLFMSAFFKQMVRFLTGGRFCTDVYDYFQSVRDDPARCPQLFLYSTKDEIVSYQQVEMHIAHRRSLGIKVLAHSWDDSAHVQHFKLHRETYTRECQEFLKMCLKE